MINNKRSIKKTIVCDSNIKRLKLWFGNCMERPLRIIAPNNFSTVTLLSKGFYIPLWSINFGIHMDSLLTGCFHRLNENTMKVLKNCYERLGYRIVCIEPAS